LAIATPNVAGLFLVQVHRRARELAVRQAIGGSRGQIVGAVMREVALVAALGSIGGVALAGVLVRLFARTFTTMPRLNELTLDARGLAFAVALSALAALVFGLWPTLLATRGDLTPALAQSSRGSSSASHRPQQALVLSQIALSVVLMASAGLVLRSYSNLAGVDRGFTAANAITFHVAAAWDEDRTRVGRLQEQLIAELEQSPDVAAAGIASFLPATGATLRSQVTLEGTSTTDDNGKITVGYRMVSGGYLRAMGASLVAGAWCPPLRVDFAAPPKTMVNRAFADRYGRDLIGRHITVSQFGGPQEIVGIVGDMIEDGPGAGAAPYMYACAQAGNWPDPEYVVRTKGDPRAVMASVGAIVRRIDPTRAIFGVKPLDAVMAAALDEPRLNARMLSLFAAAAMALASLGLYSLLTLVVAERTREMGVRMALGAAPVQVARLVVAGAGRLLVVGVAIGLLLTVAVGRALQAMLFGISALDGPTIGAAVAVLAGVTLVAAAIPARRAATLDPIRAISAE
jgi:predicted permease